ncbi:unnamed protein product, partial [Closterium sp. Yama58-4]
MEVIDSACAYIEIREVSSKLNPLKSRSFGSAGSGSAGSGSDDPGLAEPGDEILLEPARKISTESVIAGSPETEEMGVDDVPMVDIRDTQFGSVQETFTPYSKFRNVRLSWNRGVLTRMLMEEQSEWAARLRATGLRPPYALGCILRFLLKPNEEVRQLLEGLEREVHAPGLVTIGVHIRFTDGTVWEGEGEDAPKQLGEAEIERLKQVARPLLLCTQALEDWWFPPPLEVRWLIITNSIDFKIAMHQQYQNK